MFPQVGLFLNEPPAEPGCPSPSHPTTSTADCTLWVWEYKSSSLPVRRPSPLSSILELNFAVFIKKLILLKISCLVAMFYPSGSTRDGSNCPAMGATGPK